MIISAFYYGNFELKVLINILLLLRMSACAYAYALVKTSLYLGLCSLIRAFYPVPTVRIFQFQDAAMLQIPRVFPRVSCLGSAKKVQCPRPGQNVSDKSQQIPRYSPVCLRGQPPGWPLIKSALRASLLTVLRVVYAVVRLSSGETMVSILYVDLISCWYFLNTLCV